MKSVAHSSTDNSPEGVGKLGSLGRIAGSSEINHTMELARSHSSDERLRLLRKSDSNFLGGCGRSSPDSRSIHRSTQE